MAKFLDKLTKDYKDVQTAIASDCEALADLQNLNILKLKDLIAQGVDEITLEIDKLIQKGHAGKALKDFIDEKPVKEAYQGAESLVKDLQKQLDKEAKTIADLEKQIGRLDALIKATEKDLKARDFKAKFGIDSKSQAQIDKTLKDMQDCRTKTAKDLKTYKENVGSDAKKYFDGRLKTAVTGIKFVKSKDIKDVYARLVDERVVKKYMREATGHHQALLDHLAAGEKDGTPAAAKAALKAAGESLKGLKQVADFLDEGLDAHVKGSGATKDQKEMKPLFAAVDQCKKLIADAETKGKAFAAKAKATA